MTKAYLQVTPVPGKWYVSERFPASKTRWQVFDPTESRPKRTASAMIVGGPFDTRNLAMTWNIRTNASGYIWEMELVGTPTAPKNNDKKK